MPSKRAKPQTPQHKVSGPSLLSRWRFEAIFGASVLASVVLWSVGVTLRFPVWSAPIEVVRGGPADLIFRGRIIGKYAGLSRLTENDTNHLAQFTLIITAGIALYLLSVWALHRGFRHSFAAAIVATALACCAFLPSAPMGSPDAVHLAADVRTFWLHGKLPTQRENAPAKVDDPVAREVVVFNNSPSGYGPVAYAIGGLPIPFVGDSLRANFFGQKVVAALFLLLTAALSGLVAKRMGRDPGLVTGLVGLNPLMLWQFAGDGHNDTVMAAFGVGALLFITGTSWRDRGIGTVLAIVSVFSKFSLALASPLIGAYWFPKARPYFALILVGVGVSAFVIWAFRLFPIVGTVGPAGAVVKGSPWGIISAHFELAGTARLTMVGTCYLLYFTILAYMIMFQKLDTPRELVAAAGIAIFLFLFACMPGYQPWYQVWYLPFAMISGRRWLVAATLCFSLGSFYPMLTDHFLWPITNEMGVKNALNSVTLTYWVATALIAIGFYQADISGSAAQATTRATGPRRARRF